jgi:hypothetical protein
MVKLICQNCGYKVEVLEIEMYDNKCILCGERMVKDIDNKPEIETDMTNIMINNTITTQLEQEIEMLGYSAVWEFIETIGLVSKRLQYRKIFFIVGGITPINEIFKEIEDKLYLKEE